MGYCLFIGVAFFISIILFLTLKSEFYIIGIVINSMAVFLLFQMIMIYRRGKTLSGNALSVIQKRNFFTRLSSGFAFNLCMNFFENNPDITIKSTDRKNSSILATIPIPGDVIDDWRYSRDLLRFDLKEISDQHCHIYVSSRPDMKYIIPFMTLDGGSNTKNVDRISQFLLDRSIQDLVVPFDQDGKCPVCGKD
jgi:hypothetical protein